MAENQRDEAEEAKQPHFIIKWWLYKALSIRSPVLISASNWDQKFPINVRGKLLHKFGLVVLVNGLRHTHSTPSFGAVQESCRNLLDSTQKLGLSCGAVEWCFNWLMEKIRLALITTHHWWKLHKLSDSFSPSVCLPLSRLQMKSGATTLPNSGISTKYLELVGWHQQQPACFWLLFKDHQGKGSAPPSSPGRTSESQLTTVKLFSIVPVAQWNRD